jgi:aminopeptidase-like protein
MSEVGLKIYTLCKKIFPINRSITGDGVRETLNILKKEIPSLLIHEVRTGTKCFDWNIPQEWNIDDGYILNPSGNKIVNFRENNLHVMGYSIPVDQNIKLSDLNKHLYSIPEMPDAIPYVTSYYKENWGFCITHNQRKKLVDGIYRVKINSQLTDGKLTYAELLIPGETNQEVFLSTYICHPSMGNNETSGPALVTFLAKYLINLKNRRYSYRIIFVPETIGSILYLSKNFESMKNNIIAGFNVTCVGDNNDYSFLPSRSGNSLSDKVAKHVLKHATDSYSLYSFLERGSDERQYCSPLVDLPIASIMRTKYGEYDEYHTSLDDLNFISEEGLNGAYQVYIKALDAIENNNVYIANNKCEPQLGKRGLYPNTSLKTTKDIVRNMMNILAFCDGRTDLISIAEIINVPIWDLYEIISSLMDNDIVSIHNT